MNTEVSLFDYGYLKLVSYWGSDQQIIEAARMSTDKGFQGWPEDEKLLEYLWTHKHATPFEMSGLTVEVKAPIVVFREWHRHRTQSYNEMSARYTPLPDENYIPTIDRCKQASRTNKQAGRIKGSQEPSDKQIEFWLRKLQDVYDQAQMCYESGLNMGIPKEIARLPVPVARYSRMRASANLRNWLAFLTLRMDTAAQYEIRAYANALGKIISELFPRTWKIFEGSK